MRFMNMHRETLRDALLSADEALKENDHDNRMVYLTIARDAALGVARELELMKRIEESNRLWERAE
jgi:hypothetical protein